MPRTARLSVAEKARIHRQRRREAGIEDVLLGLSVICVQKVPLRKAR
jgi:hypothetical protein